MHYASLLAMSLAVAPGMAVSSAAQAQTYPNKAVRMIVPFPPGGSTDIIARTTAQVLSESWGLPVVVDNRPGAATIIGTDVVAKSAPDGYTLLFTGAVFSTNPTLFAGKLPYDTLADFAPITLINTTPLVLVVNPNLPARSMKELIALAKSRPGQMNYGSSALGGSNHLSGELLNLMAGISIVHVPYKGNAPAITDLLGGRVDLLFNGTTSVLPLITSGKLRALAVSGRQRTDALPDVPTLDESGLKGFESTAWNGMAAPAKTPPGIISKINADAVKAVNSAVMMQRLKADGSDPVGSTPAQFLAFVKDEIAKWAKVIKFANVKAE